MPFCAPQIAFSKRWTGITTAISETLLSIPNDGLYRITFELDADASGVPSTQEADITFTFAKTLVSEQMQVSANIQSAANTVAAQTFQIAGSTSITLTTEVDAGSPSPFNVTVVIEQLA
jgi:hypothetical protein